MTGKITKTDQRAMLAMTRRKIFLAVSMLFAGNPSRLALTGLMLVSLAFTDTQVKAQTATDLCSYGVGSQYAVGSTCTYQSFNKPNSFTNAVAATGCGANSFNDAFGWFTATATTTIIIFEPPNNTDPILHAFTGACGSLVQVGCVNAFGSSIAETLVLSTTIGTNYLVRVQRASSDNNMNGNMCVYSPPANDDPCGATNLTLGTSCTYVSYNSAGATATAGIPAPGCSTYSGGDVWYKFTAPASRTATIRTTAGSISNLAMALYTASSCNGAFTLIECDNLDGPGNMPFLTFTEADLVAGETYYLRVWQNGGGTGTFNLCANTAPATGNCALVLRMNDSMGDGWGGSTVNVQVGAGPVVSYTNTNSDQEVAYIPVNNGQNVQISYTSLGGGQGEITYILQQGAGILYADGPTPGTGLRFAVNISCNSPPAPPKSDCRGGTTLCSGQQINDNSTNTGIKADLTIANRGCLNSDERQGTWYNFSPSASGTIAFTIAPTNPSDDYDFAVWGPSTSVACPPGSSPFRCNYSATTGNTGLSTTASNPSEGASGSKWSSAMTVTTGQVYILYVSNYSRSGVSFDLSFQLTNGASLNCTALPVEMAHFSGNADRDKIRLEWATASESHSSHFVVERAMEGLEFGQIGQVAAVGNSFTYTNYGFADLQPMNGLNYYRLKEVDTDGTAKFSNTIVIPFRRNVIAGNPYPNPANDRINVDLHLAADANVRINVLDASGRLVLTRFQQVSAGSEQHVSMPVEGLETGSYELLLELPNGEVVHTGRFMLM